MKKIPLPESQIQEVLFELINRTFICRKTMMLSCSILNLTAQISALRRKGCNIKTNDIKTFNKYGCEVTFAQYSLSNKANAAEIYKEMKANQAGIPEA